MAGYAVADSLSSMSSVEGVLNSGVWFGGAGMLAAVAMVVSGRAAAAVVLAATLCLGAGWWMWRQVEWPRTTIAALLPEAYGTGEAPPQPTALRFRGLVLDDPRLIPVPTGPFEAAHREESWRFMIDVREVGAIGGGPLTVTRGRLTVFVAGGVPSIRAGEVVEVSGRAERVPPPLNPGEFDLRGWSISRGVVGSVNVPSPELVRVAGGGSLVDGAHGLALRLQADLRARALRVAHAAIGPEASPESRALLASLLLGESSPDLAPIERAFTRLGLAHVLAISGFHLVVMAGVGVLLIRLTGEHGPLEAWIVSAFVLIYLVIVPPGAPVVRAGVLVLAVLASEAMGRRYVRITLLGWAGVGLILWRPMDAWSLGFQLSLGLTMLLLWLGQTAHERLWGIRVLGTLDRPRWALLPWVATHAKGLLSASVLCWVVSAPLLMSRTGMVSPLAVLTTLVVSPLIGLLLAVGYAVIVLGMLVPALASQLEGVFSPLATATMDIVRWADQLPFASLTLPAVNPWWSAAATLLAMYWFARGHWRDRWAWAAAVALGTWFGIEMSRSGRLPDDVTLRIDALSVGDGSCHLIRSGDEAMLYDCGSLRRQVGVRLVPDAVRALGGGRVKRVIISHPDVDHFSGLLDVVGPLGVREVFVGERFQAQAERHPQGPAAYILHELRRRGVSVSILRGGDELTLGRARVRVVWPDAGFDRTPSGAMLNDNEHSLVMCFEVGTGAGVKTLLMNGDIQQHAIDGVRTLEPDLRADICEAPHHGSALPESIRWIAQLRPEVVLQSTGASRVGDPRWKGVRQMTDWRATPYDGASWAEIRSDGTIRAGSFRTRGG